MWRWLSLLLISALASADGLRADGPMAALEQRLNEAATALQQGEMQIAESRYRSALLEGWLLESALDVARGDLEGALVDLEQSMRVSVERQRSMVSQAMVLLRLERHTEAAQILRSVLLRFPENVTARRVLAQTLNAAGDTENAAVELEEAWRTAPDDLEVAFALAVAYLRLERDEEAASLFNEISTERPIPQTWVLIGRTYRDFHLHDRAREALRKALELDPQVRRAHYYLGTVDLLDEEQLEMDAAIDFFEKELTIAPDDEMAHLFRGMALTVNRRFEEAVPSLESASRSSDPPPDAFHHLGRCYFALGRDADAVRALTRALELLDAQLDQLQGEQDSNARVGEVRRRGSIHYLLGQVQRRMGDMEAARTSFAAAQRYSRERAASDRVLLSEYLSDAVPSAPETAFPPQVEAIALEGLPPEELATIERAVQNALARSYFDLGVLRLQGAMPEPPNAPPTTRFARAGDLFAAAAEIQPGFPQVQYSVGIARFNAEQYRLAVPALENTVKNGNADPSVQRMLALSWLYSDAYDKAAAALSKDPERTTNPALQYAYSVALVNLGRTVEARRIFRELLAANPQWAELHVLEGQALAKEKDFAAAIPFFERALSLKDDVADARIALGEIALRRGDLEEAEKLLRRELAIRPNEQQARYLLATVLDSNRRSTEAVPLLRELLRARPNDSNGHYLLGKILLAEGEAEEAAERLREAARLAPNDSHVFYQLGQAYQRLGQRDQAREQFDIYRRLKDAE